LDRTPSPCAAGYRKKKFDWGTVISGIWGMEIEPESPALKLSTPTARKFLEESETFNKIRRHSFRERMIPNMMNRNCLKIEDNIIPRKRRQHASVRGCD
jgi:hypothetical protein